MKNIYEKEKMNKYIKTYNLYNDHTLYTGKELKNIVGVSDPKILEICNILLIFGFGLKGVTDKSKDINKSRYLKKIQDDPSQISCYWGALAMTLFLYKNECEIATQFYNSFNKDKFPKSDITVSFLFNYFTSKSIFKNQSLNKQILERLQLREQRILINLDPTFALILNEKGILKPELKEEFKDLFDAEDLGLMYRENLNSDKYNESADEMKARPYNMLGVLKMGDIIVDDRNYDTTLSRKPIKREDIYLFLAYLEKRGADPNQKGYILLNLDDYKMRNYYCKLNEKSDTTIEEYLKSNPLEVSPIIDALKNVNETDLHYSYNYNQTKKVCDIMVDKLLSNEEISGLYDAHDLGLLYQEKLNYISEHKILSEMDKELTDLGFRVIWELRDISNAALRNKIFEYSLIIDNDGKKYHVEIITPKNISDRTTIMFKITDENNKTHTFYKNEVIDFFKILDAQDLGLLYQESNEFIYNYEKDRKILSKMKKELTDLGFKVSWDNDECRDHIDYYLIVNHDDKDYIVDIISQNPTEFVFINVDDDKVFKYKEIIDFFKNLDAESLGLLYQEDVKYKTNRIKEEQEKIKKYLLPVGKINHTATAKMDQRIFSVNWESMKSLKHSPFVLHLWNTYQRNRQEFVMKLESYYSQRFTYRRFNHFYRVMEYLKGCDINEEYLDNMLQTDKKYDFDDYKSQKKLIEYNPLFINKFEEIHPNIKKEYGDLIDAADLGLFYNESIDYDDADFIIKEYIIKCLINNDFIFIESINQNFQEETWVSIDILITLPDTFSYRILFTNEKSGPSIFYKRQGKNDNFKEYSIKYEEYQKIKEILLEYINATDLGLFYKENFKYIKRYETFKKI